MLRRCTVLPGFPSIHNPDVRAVVAMPLDYECVCLFLVGQPGPQQLTVDVIDDRRAYQSRQPRLSSRLHSRLHRI